MGKAPARKENKIQAKFGLHKDSSLALLLFVLLVSIYCLTYSGTFITDDEHILASRTLSLGFDENVNNDRVYGNSRLFFLSNLSPEYAASAMNVEPAQAFFGSLLARISVLLNIGHIQTIFIFNIGVIAFTAVVLFLVTRFLGYSKFTAFCVCILFGLGTMVWPYTKTYFRDPLAMMFLTIAWASALIIGNKRYSLRSKYFKILAWFGLFIGTIAGVLSKNTVVIAIPALFVYLLIMKCAEIPSGTIQESLQKNWKTFLLIFGCAVLLLMIWVVYFPSRGIFSRFTFDYYKYLATFFITTPHPKFLEAILGPLISPGKSIFIYSPILILSFYGSIEKWNIAWPAWFYLIMLVVGQALFYDDGWSGHINWGLRFILPAIPPLLIAAIPAIDGWLKTRIGRIGLLAVGGLSVLIQVIGTLPPMRQFYVEIINIDPALIKSAAIWRFNHSPLAWHIKWLLAGGELDLAAARVGISAIPIVLGFIILEALAIISLKHPLKKSLPYFNFVLMAGLVIAMLFTYKRDPYFYIERLDLFAAQEEVRNNVMPDDLVVIKSYNTPVWYYWMNWAEPIQNWVSLPLYFPKPNLIEEYRLTNNPEVALVEASVKLFPDLPDKYSRVWLVLPSDTPGATLNIEVDWLMNNSATNTNWKFKGDVTETRLYLFEFVGQ